jgi:hypothetical protein
MEVTFKLLILGLEVAGIDLLIRTFFARKSQPGVQPKKRSSY